MDRRTFIASAVGLGATAFLTACAHPTVGSPSLEPKVALAGLAPVAPGPQAVPFDPSRIIPQRIPFGPIYSLGKSGKGIIAWTVDDGFGDDVTQAYARFAERSGMRMTFFVCDEAPGWRHAQPTLQPLIDSGQVQIGNHTRTHSNLMTLSDQAIQDDLMTNHQLIEKMFGVDARPYFRPPFGKYDDRVAAAAARVGYTVPVLWNGTLSDSGEIPPETLLDFADRYMSDGNILLGHANWWPVTTVYPQLTDILETRDLMSVTLNDVFST